MIKVIFLSLWQYFTQILLKKTVPICFIMLLNVNFHLKCFLKQKANAELKGLCLQMWCGEPMPESPGNSNYICCKITSHAERIKKRSRETCLCIVVCVFSTLYLFSFYLYLSISWNIFPDQVVNILYVSILFHVSVLQPVSLLRILLLLYGPEHIRFI